VFKSYLYLYTNYFFGDNPNGFLDFYTLINTVYFVIDP